MVLTLLVAAPIPGTRPKRLLNQINKNKEEKKGTNTRPWDPITKSDKEAIIAIKFSKKARMENRLAGIRGSADFFKALLPNKDKNNKTQQMSSILAICIFPLSKKGKSSNHSKCVTIKTPNRIVGVTLFSLAIQSNTLFNITVKT